MKLCKSKHWRRILIYFILPLTLFYLPIPVKTAVQDEYLHDIVNGEYINDNGEYSNYILNSEDPIDLQDFVGEAVTLVCEVNTEVVTDPSDNEFYAIAMYRDGIPTAVKFSYAIYVRPKQFVGGSIRKAPHPMYGNIFIFRGTLKNATRLDGKDYLNSFRISLSSWDIIYPVHHCYWHLWPDSDYYRGHLFIFDYMLPKFFQPDYLT